MPESTHHFPHLGHLYKSTWKACWYPHYWDDIREFGGLVGLEASIAWIGEQKSSRANHCFLPSTVKAFVWILWGSMTWSDMIPAKVAEVLWIIISHIWQSLTRTTNNRSKIRRSTCRWQNESEKDPLQEEMTMQLRSGLLFTWYEPRLLLIFLSVEAPGRQEMLGSVEPKL